MEGSVADFSTCDDILAEMNEPDMQLLERYSRDKAEDAFAELVQRHVGLVYSAALRQVHSPHLAEEIAQSVFLDLARKAGELRGDTVLPAWLYQVARRTAVDVIRRETRRQAREQIALQLTAMNTNSSAGWNDLEHFLDEAMQALDPTDRTAILLRYFEKRSLREVGEACGMSENAAQKRLSRAMERLHGFFKKRGINVTASGLAALISANGVQAVPATLTTAICSAVVQATTTTTIATAALTAMTTTQKAILAFTFVATVGTGVYQTHRANDLQKELESLRLQFPKVAEFEQMAHERDKVLDQLAALRAENERLKRNTPELVRLRGEVTRLRTEADAQEKVRRADERIETAARKWLDRVNQLKHRLEHMPGAEIPEMQLLTEEDWLAAVKQPNLQTDEEYRKAFANLRNAAQSKFAVIAHAALVKYMKSNNWSFPTDLSQLQAYCEPAPLHPAILERYVILPAPSVPNVKVAGDWAITQKSPVDAELDMRIVIGPDGHGSASYPPNMVNQTNIDALAPAVKAFSTANNGREPVDPSQLEPYLTTTEQQIAFEKVMQARSK